MSYEPLQVTSGNIDMYTLIPRRGQSVSVPRVQVNPCKYLVGYLDALMQTNEKRLEIHHV
jgi:hypothetical protein